jgi:hypothetical protein
LSKFDFVAGDEVMVFTDYGRNSDTDVVARVDTYDFTLGNGKTYSSWELGRRCNVIKTDSKAYRDAVTKHAVDVIIDTIRPSDAMEHPEVLDALKLCAKIIGEKELNDRHKTLCAMGASNSVEKAIYREVF